MTWHQRYRIRNFVGNSLWIWPVLGIVVAIVTARFFSLIEPRMPLAPGVSPDAAKSVLNALASSMFTCIIFAGSALLLAVQLASAQLTPRMITLVFKDPLTKLSLTVFVFAFTFSLSVLVRIGDVVPLRTTQVAAYSCLVSLGLFLVLIDHVGKFLRPSGALQNVAMLGHKVIQATFPRHLFETPSVPPQPQAPLDIRSSYTVTTASSGVFLALDIRGLVSLAQRYDCTIVMLSQVGNFVPAGNPMFRIYHGEKKPPDRALHQAIAVGPERTFQQDPALAFRLIVDVASKALSPAINDPTTAVLAIDQIHHLLRNVGTRWLNEGEVRDAAGRLRLVYRTPDWEDFVHLAATEIRQFGAGSIQITRRLLAMLENLIESLTEERTHLLNQELKILRHTIKRSFLEPEDQALAGISDLQGVGGKAEEYEKNLRDCHKSPKAGA